MYIPTTCTFFGKKTFSWTAVNILKLYISWFLTLKLKSHLHMSRFLEHFED